jgi:hypothetical protein
MRTLLALSLVLGCANSSSSSSHGRLAGPIQKTGACSERRFDVKDSLGESVSLGSNEEQLTTVVVLLSRAASEEASQFIRQIDERLLNAPVQIVGIVDLHRYSGALSRSLAERSLRRAANDSREKRRQRRQKQGVDASPTFVNRWHVIGDFAGKLLARFGVQPEPPEPVAFVVNSCGQVRGPFHDVNATLAAVGHGVPAKTARTSSSSRASRRASAAR